MRNTANDRAALRLALHSAVLLICLALPALSMAQSESSNEQQAGTHFERGVELYGEGNLDAALVEFERAYELVPTYRVLYNLGQLQAERNEYVAALELFEKYLAEGDAEIPAARKAETNAEIAKLRARVAELWVDTDVAGAQLFVNDKLVGALPLWEDILINPGVCHLRVEKDGQRAATRTVKVASGDKLRIEMPLEDAAQAPEAARADTAHAAETSASYKPFWLSSAAALAVGGSALTFGLLTRAADRDLSNELARFPVREAELADQRSKVKTYAGLTDGFAAAAAVTVGVALYFLIAPPQAPARARDVASGKSLHVLPGPGGVSLLGRF